MKTLKLDKRRALVAILSCLGVVLLMTLALLALLPLFLRGRSPLRRRVWQGTAIVLPLFLLGYAAYASTFAWRPDSEPPPNVQTWIRCRLRVEGGAIGVSLLSADERVFVDSQVVSSTADAVNAADAVLLA